MALRDSGQGAIISLDGGQELLKLLERLDEKVQKQVVKIATREGAEVVRDAAKQLCPVRTGSLQRAIKIRAKRKRGSRGRLSRGDIGHSVVIGEGTFITRKKLVTGKVFYGGFVEFGTKHNPAHPFLRPAAKQNEGRVAELFKKNLLIATNEAIRLGGKIK